MQRKKKPRDLSPDPRQLDLVEWMHSEKERLDRIDLSVDSSNREESDVAQPSTEGT